MNIMLTKKMLKEPEALEHLDFKLLPLLNLTSKKKYIWTLL